MCTHLAVLTLDMDPGHTRASDSLGDVLDLVFIYLSALALITAPH